MKKVFLVLTVVASLSLSSVALAANNLVEQDLYPNDENVVVDINADTSLDINADVLSVGGLCFTDVDLTASMGSTGANGLESGDTETSSVWYEVYVIAKKDGEIAGLLNEYDTSITMPTDYIFKRRIGWVRNDSSSDFCQQERRGVTGYFDAWDKTAADKNNFTSTQTDWDLSDVIPPNAVAAEILINVKGSANDHYIVCWKKGSSGNGWNSRYYKAHVANLDYLPSHLVPVDENQEITCIMNTSLTTKNAVITGWVEK